MTWKVVMHAVYSTVGLTRLVNGRK